MQREAARQEQARLAQLEAQKQEAERRAAAGREAARQEALAQEAARQEAARQAQAGQAQAGQAQARQAQEKLALAQREKAQQEAQREERLRAIGRQLNEEAAKRDAAAKLPPTTSSLRRGWLFGRSDANADMVQYAQAMSHKIEMNQSFDTVRELIKQPHAQPIVTVAVRADGSVEKVTFVVSSGNRALDAAIEAVVANQAPYGKFPPNLARQYDVIEIRRTWIFDMAIRLE